MNEESLPRPFYVLRGHQSGVTSVHFYKEDGLLSLLSTDQEGHAFVWSLKTKRTVLRWKAHDKSVLTGFIWRQHYVTHGRDNTLRLWQRPSTSEEGDCEPILRNTIPVNSLNFCKAALLQGHDEDSKYDGLVAVPSSRGSEKIDIYQLCDGKRLVVGICPDDSNVKESRTSMVMSMSFWAEQSLLRLLSAYEDGSVNLFSIDCKDDSTSWQLVWTCRQHQEPVMDLRTVATGDGSIREAYSCGADDLLVQYTFESILPKASDDGSKTDDTLLAPRTKTRTVISSGHAALAIRPLDGRLLALAGWDGQVNLYSNRTLDPIVPLHYHKKSAQAIDWYYDKDTSLSVIGVGSADERISLWYDILSASIQGQR